MAKEEAERAASEEEKISAKQKAVHSGTATSTIPLPLRSNSLEEQHRLSDFLFKVMGPISARVRVLIDHARPCHGHDTVCVSATVLGGVFGDGGKHGRTNLGVYGNILYRIGIE